LSNIADLFQKRIWCFGSAQNRQELFKPSIPLNMDNMKAIHSLFFAITILLISSTQCFCLDVYDDETGEYLFDFGALMRQENNLPPYPIRDPFEKEEDYTNKVAAHQNAVTAFYNRSYFTYIVPKADYEIESEIMTIEINRLKSVYIEKLGLKQDRLKLKFFIDKFKAKKILNTGDYLKCKVVFDLNETNHPVKSRLSIHQVTLYHFDQTLKVWF
jgi:hypothetical protein